MQLGRIRWVDADNSSCSLAWAWVLLVALKRVRPEQNPAQTPRVHPNDQPVAGVTPFMTPQLTDPVAKVFRVINSIRIRQVCKGHFPSLSLCATDSLNYK